MSATNQFSGLAMPVFTAFGWAGEETAINYALDQLEIFIRRLHADLSAPARAELPVAGISRGDQCVYLAAESEVEEGVHIMFYARPMSLELQLTITEKKVLTQALKAMTAQPTMAHRLITELGADWSLRVQQMQVDEDSGETAHYQDIFKDSLVKFDPDTAAEVFSKAAYLNGEDKWVTPIYLNRRFMAEQAAAMGPAITKVMGQHIDSLLPLLHFLFGKTTKGRSKATRSRGKTIAAVSAETAVSEVPAADEEGFTYVAELKPLHIRRGFVNMTPEHWPFFAINSRTETRPVTVYYDGVYDKDSAVWRMQPNEMARLVLSPTVQQWIEDNFEVDDKIHLSITRLADDEIQVSLKSVQ